MNKEYICKIKKVEGVTPNVKRFILDKPLGYNFIQGQAVDISINLPDYKNFKRPFTFTSLNEEPYLEFTIKIYGEREGVTKKMAELGKGDELILEEPFGSISFHGNGFFIAGGAGVTPFIAILRKLKKENKLKGNALLLSNRTEKDIILKKEIEAMKREGLEAIHTLTREKNKKYLHGRIDEAFLKERIKDFFQYFYVCGPLRFVGEIQHLLQKLGADPEKIVVET